MPLNDHDHHEFDHHLQDEDMFDAHHPPGTEIGEALQLEVDRGSGSFAQDGRLEVAEDQVMLNGEDTLMGSAAMYGPTEIGFHDDEFQAVDRNYDTDVGSTEAADRGGSEIGDARNAGYIAKYGPSEIGTHFPEEGAAEIGSELEHDPESALGLEAPFESFMLGPTRMGDDDELGAGHFPLDGASEIGAGHFPLDGASEIGTHYPEEGAAEIGAGHYPTEGASEIGAAVLKVIEKARDNRQPPPPMKAVSVDDPLEEDHWGLEDVVIGAANVTGADQFPLLSQLLVRAGAGTEARIVRVDTEASYKQFRTESSPELAELSQRLDAHIADPHAHQHDEPESDVLSDDIEDLVHLGAEVQAAEAEKRVEMWMPKRFDGKIETWREGGNVCASIVLPSLDGEVRICTALEPIRKCVAEMARHAAEAGVPAAAVVGVLPAMGCALGAGTAVKEMAAAAPSLIKAAAGSQAPFMVRIEPKVAPTLAALAMLAWACKEGNAQACSEWDKLGAVSAGPVKQAMAEALQLVKAAA
jgi:hypothetical protein